MLQLSVAAGATVLTFSDTVSGNAGEWKWGVAGFIFVVLGIAMLRIGSGISKNAAVLQEVGNEVGDIWIPIPTRKHKSVSFWIALSITFLGFICLVTSLVKYFS